MLVQSVGQETFGGGILRRAGKEVEVCVLASLASSQSSSGFTLAVNAGADRSVSQFRRGPPALTTRVSE